MRFVVSVLGIVSSVGCVGATGPRHQAKGEPVAAFPQRGELEVFAQKPVKPNVQRDEVDVEQWQVDPGNASAGDEPTFWERTLADRFGANSASPGGAVTIAPELHCAAREVARFYVANASFPTEQLQDFLALRCGSTSPRIDAASLAGTAPDSVADEAVEKHFEPQLRQLFDKIPIQHGPDLGIGFARGNGRFSVVILSGEVGARLAGFTPVVTTTTVTLRGRLRETTAEMALAVANRGPWGSLPCQADPKVALPEFSFSCPFASEDAATRIEIGVRQPRRVLLDSVAQVLVRRGPADALKFEPSLLGDPASAPDAHAFRDGLYKALNQARQAAGVGQLAVEARQAEANEQLVGHCFQATMQGDRALADRIALGLLAGWEVQGTIRDGSFAMGGSLGDRRVGRWLSARLDRPLTRSILLEPDLTRVAIGATDVDPRGVAVLVTAYALYQASDHARAMEVLQTELTRERATINRARPNFLPPSKELLAAVNRIETEQVSAMSALQDTLNDLGTGTPMKGYAIETVDLQHIQWPAELLFPEQLQVELGLTHYKPKNAAWGQYAVVFVIRSSERTAKAGPRSARARI